VSSDAEREAYLDSVLVGGREPVSISVVDYDESWPRMSGEVRAGIRAALGSTAVTVEHIGSTSVPGLAAKPVLDVLVTVADVVDEAAYRPRLEAAGFQLRVREPEHRMFRTAEKDVHVHVYEPEHEAVGSYLDLRDWLRHSAKDRELYASTKRDLATREWRDMNDYADAKSHVIQDILRRARGAHPSSRRR
jgi:GrpB-like predicted nucleotidyltransferase (UPF0157 family)